MFKQLAITHLSKINAWTAPDSLAEEALAESGTTAGLYGGFFDMDDKDSRYLIKIENIHPTTAATVYVEPGDAHWAGVKPSVSVPAGKVAYIQVESGRHKFVTEGAPLLAHCADTITSKGKVFLTGTSSSLVVTVFHTVL